MQPQSTKITITCPRCNKPFKVYPSEHHRRKFCSRECARPLIPRVCQHCRRRFLATGSLVRHNWAKHCSWECRQATRRKQVKPRFWAKVRKTTKCWLWCGQKQVSGYGFFSYQGRSQLAHRMAWLLTHGEIPKGLWVLHRCDNKVCVRPGHLFLGTRADNIADMIAKGRHSHGDTHPSRLKPEYLPRGESHWEKRHPERILRGEQRPQAKLTVAQVLAIRELRAAGKSLKEIAAIYGIHPGTVSEIALRRRWQHV